MARRFATRIGPIRVRIDSQKSKLLFITCERFARITSNLRFAIFKSLGVQFGNPETIRENQAIRANLRIDSRESGPSKRKNLREPLGSFKTILRI